MSKETRDFEDSMRKAFKLIEKKASKAAKNAFIDMFSAIIDDTPIGDPSIWKNPSVPKGYIPGTLVSNWTTQIGAQPTAFIQGNQDPTGARTKADMKSTVMAWDSKQPLYFANNTPYAEVVEFGYSRVQAPQGMFRLNILKFNGLIAQYAKQEKD